MSRPADDMINDQIYLELQKLNSIVTDEEDKPAIIQRIADLKAMLDPSAPRATVQQPSIRDLFADAIRAFRER